MIIFIIVIVSIKIKYYPINKIIFLSHEKQEKKRERNTISITYFIIFLQQILSSMLLQDIIDHSKKIISVVGWNQNLKPVTT